MLPFRGSADPVAGVSSCGRMAGRCRTRRRCRTIPDDALAGLVESLLEAGANLDRMPGYPEWDGRALDVGWAVDGLPSSGSDVLQRCYDRQPEKDLLVDPPIPVAPRTVAIITQYRVGESL